jgi:hypothetical protein
MSDKPQAALRDRMMKLTKRCAKKLVCDWRVLTGIMSSLEVFVWQTVHEGLHHGTKDTKILDEVIQGLTEDPRPEDAEEDEADQEYEETVDKNGHPILLRADGSYSFVYPDPTVAGVAVALILLEQHHGENLEPDVYTAKPQSELDKLN